MNKCFIKVNEKILKHTTLISKQKNKKLLEAQFVNHI